MGSPTIWYYPDPEGGVTALTLPELDTLDMLPDVDVVSARSRSGATSVHMFSSFRRWRLGGTITLQATLRAMRSFEAHVWRGGAFAFALDSAKAWAGAARRQVRRGDTTLLVSPFALFNDSAALTAGDDVWIESANPERYADLREVSTFSASSITVDAGVSYTFRAFPTVIRHADYLPAVVQSRETLGAPILADLGQRIAFRFELEVSETPRAVAALAEGQGLRGASLAYGRGPLDTLGVDKPGIILGGR